MEYTDVIDAVLNRVGVGFMLGFVLHYMWRMTSPPEVKEILNKT